MNCYFLDKEDVIGVGGEEGRRGEMIAQLR